MANDGMMRRGAATDLMEQVGDALAAPRQVASVAGEKSMWWSPEKGVRTKKSGQSSVSKAQSASSKNSCPVSPSVPSWQPAIEKSMHGGPDR